MGANFIEAIAPLREIAHWRRNEQSPKEHRRSTDRSTLHTHRGVSEMELRHLRYFIAVAEELHFARAAERLHIEQSPLSRAIKDLETDLGVQLFEREPRGTRMTWAGQVWLDGVRRVFTALDQAKSNLQAAASGFRGTLRIALSDGLVPQRLAELALRILQVGRGGSLR